MSLSELQHTLQQNISGERMLLLNVQTIDAPRIIKLFAGVLGADHLALAAVGDPQLSADGSRLTLTGQATLLGLVGVGVVGVFVMRDDKLHFSLKVPLPQGWTLARSFPELLGDAADLFDDVTFYNAAFVISSIDYHDDDLELDVAPGLNFSARIALDGPFEPVNALLTQNDLVRLSGSIDFTKDASGKRIPSFAIQADVPALIELGPVTIHDISVELGTLVYVDAAFEPPERVGFWAALNGSLSLGEVTVELAASIPAEPDGTFEFAATFDGLHLPTLGDIAQLAGGDDLADALPPQLADAGDIGVNALRFGIAPRRKTIEFVTVEVGTASAWTIVPELFSVESISAQWIILAPTQPASRQMKGTIAGSLALAESQLQIEAELPEAQIHAWLTDDQPLQLLALLQEIIPGLPVPDALQALAISQLDMQANPKLKTFSITAAIDDVLSLDLESIELAIEQLSLSLDYAPPSSIIKLSGDANLLDIGWTLEVERRATTRLAAGGTSTTPGGTTTTSEWAFAGRLAEGSEIRLMALVDEFAAPSGTSIGLPEGLDIGITDLQFSVDTGETKEYRFAGAFDWVYSTSDVSFTIDAAVEIRSWLYDGISQLPDGVLMPAGTTAPAKNTRLREGMISGAVTFENIEVDFFDNFTIAAIYRFKPGSGTVAFQFKKGEFELDATFGKGRGAAATHTIITVGFGSQTTFGSLLTLLAQIADPDIEEFTLDSPWDELNTLKLSGLSLAIDLTTKEVAVVYKVEQTFFDGLVKIGTLSLKVTKVAGKTRLIIDVNASVLGKALPAWDALNERPPTVPGKGNAIFDLSYLGLGQHVALTGVAELDTITKVINAMRAAVVATEGGHANPLARAGAVAFNPNSGWLIGAQFKVIDTVALSAIFNDPLIYGMRVELSGPRAQQFAGLVFEILYRRITDTIGVYHIELVLPDAMRQIQVGIVSLTLPVVVLDIYTNGDFKIDLGFPWNGNFDRSFAINVLIFMGAGGFYFNKLSAATATSVPKIAPEVGTFNPVIEFGLGLKVGLGRTFSKGPLEAEISITLQGVVQGVFAWFHPNRSDLHSEQYYMVKGGVAIVGRLWGRVDFEIIQIEVEVIARAMIVFKVESYRATLVTLSATVSVRASITIVFIEIHFSFELTITQSFTLGSDTVAPWDRRLPATSAAAAIAGPPAAMLLGAEAAPGLRWRPISVWDAPAPIAIYFLPALARSDAGAHGVALLFLPNAVASSGASPAAGFDRLAEALFKWAIEALPSLDQSQITFDDLDQLYRRITSEPAADDELLNFQNLSAFLRQNFTFQLSSPTASAGTINATLFPMFPNLVLKPTKGDEINFWSAHQLSAADRQQFANYFQALSSNTSTGGSAPKNSGAGSAATFSFVDYFALLMRSTVQFAADIMGARRNAADELDRQAQTLRQQADANEQRASTFEQQAGLLRTRADSLRMPAGQPNQPADELDQQVDELDRQAQTLRQQAGDLRGQNGNPANSASDLEQRARALRTATYDQLLATLKDEQKFQQLAGMVSRFMLHGIRLPWSGGQPGATTPLYAITAQQFDLPPDAAATDVVTLSRNNALKDPTLPNIDFGAGQTALTRQLGPDPLNSLREAKPLAPPVPTLLPFYTDVPRHFNLQHTTAWQSSLAGGPAQILDLPEPMQAYLSARGTDGAALDLKIGQPDLTGANQGRDQVHDLSGYPWAWATRVRVSVRRIATPNGLIDRTYLVAGISEDDKQRLAATWEYLNRALTQPSLYLLYPNPGGGLIDQTPTSSLLLKTNLATTSNPTANVLAAHDAQAADLTYSASLSQGRDFLKLLWESSIVGSGGYFLHYEANNAGLPAQVFADGLAGALELLIVLEAPDMAEHKVARPFHNCLLIDGVVDLGGGVLFAETTDTVKVQHIPSGHLGFHLDRSRPDAGDHLGELYQLLGYQLQDNAMFRASNEGLPIGPTAGSASADAWVYERVLPLFRFAKDTVIATGTSGLPDAARNPYAGIKQAASPSAALPQATVDFYWQDVYGNRYGEHRAQTVPVRYIDPLLGINQWPTVAESYTFSAIAGDADHVLLRIELAFEHSGYIPADGVPTQNLRDKVSSTHAVYERIYYQIHQPDVSFTFTTSVLPGARHTFSAAEKQQLTNFVDLVYLYLVDLEKRLRAASVDTTPPPPIGASVSIALAKTAAGQPPYPAEIIFPVIAQVDMARDPALCDTTLGVVGVQQSTAFLKASTTPNAAGTAPSDDTASEIASLRAFATAFQGAFDGLRLAVGDARQRQPAATTPDDSADPVPQPLWAVQLGSGGLSYNIHEELPFFFTPAPLANTLLSGTVDVNGYSLENGLDATQTSQKRVEAIDVDVLARDFLVAIEAFLDPSIAMPATQRAQTKTKVDAILNHKRLLAEAIGQQVTNILAQTDSADISARRQIAADMLRQQLLINLVEAYDIETIIQYNVDVALAQGRALPGANAPRLYGQPVAQQIKRSDTGAQVDAPLLNFSLSPAKMPLAPGQSYLTFFFNTRTPEKFEDLTLNLAYRANEIEHDITDIPGIAGYQASSWLSFILPLDPTDDQGMIPADSPNTIGDTPIPIALRTYPIPPSLILHAAEADPDSLERLEDIRQWQYTYVYEHLDIAQDTIDTAVVYNITTSNGTTQGTLPATASGNTPPNLRELFNQLVNFSMIYPQLAPHLQLLAAADHAASDEAIDRAVAALEQLVGRVAQAWNNLPSASAPTVQALSAEYEIDEIATQTTREVTIATAIQNQLPLVEVPGFALQTTGDTMPPRNDPTRKAITYTFTQKTPEEAAKDPIYGESSIPDRKLTIQNLDLIEQQNAWGSIWLTRNKELIAGWRTNPLFIYQTPQVRFTNKITPLLANGRAWYIDTLGAPDAATSQPASLADHIQRLLVTLLPAQASQAYDIRVACQYAFALAAGADDDLIATLPVLLGPRFTILAGASMLDATADFRASLAATIQAWLQQQKPVERKGMFIFNVALFSHLAGADQEAGDNLPLLRIENLRLRLEAIAGDH